MSEAAPDEQQSSIDKLKEIYKTANREHADASLGQRALLATTFGSIAFEWSSGNESMLGFVAGTMHELTHNPLATSVVTGGASFAEQSVIGVLMAMTIHSYPEVTAKVREIVTAGGEKSDTFLKRYGSAMLLGAGVEVAKENAVRPHDRKENVQRVLGSAGLIAVSNTTLIAGLSGLLKLGEENGFEVATATVVDIASNPLTYVAVLAGVIGFSRLKKYARKLKQKPESTIQIESQPSAEAAGD